ncbi:MAG: hypothetical protein JNK92_06985 [Dechloromonas sp.]|nr:hypothetical protein [Dechloromonas sp.]
MQGSFEYKINANGDKVVLSIDLDSVCTKALVRLDRYINWADVLKLTENDQEASYAAERLHTALQHLGR